MFNQAFLDVLTHDGVVSVTTWADDTVHVANSWNRYLQLTEDNKILLPAAWFHKTEKNISNNNRLIMTLGSPEVQGKVGMGTGFVIEGSAKFLESGENFDMMKEKFSFMTRLMEITPASVKQTI